MTQDVNEVIREAVHDHGMKNVLKALIVEVDRVMADGKEPYLVTLRRNLVVALTTYADRYVAGKRA